MDEVELRGLIAGADGDPRATPGEREDCMAERLDGPFGAEMEAEVSERVTSSYWRHGLDVAHYRQDDATSEVGRRW